MPTVRADFQHGDGHDSLANFSEYLRQLMPGNTRFGPCGLGNSTPEK